MKPASHEPGPCKFLAAVQRAGAGPQYSCLWWLQVLQVANSTAALQQPRRYGQTTCQYARTNYLLWLCSGKELVTLPYLATGARGRCANQILKTVQLHKQIM